MLQSSNCIGYRQTVVTSEKQMVGGDCYGRMQSVTFYLRGTSGCWHQVGPLWQFINQAFSGENAASFFLLVYGKVLLMSPRMFTGVWKSVADVTSYVHWCMEKCC